MAGLMKTMFIYSPRFAKYSLIRQNINTTKRLLAQESTSKSKNFKLKVEISDSCVERLLKIGGEKTLRVAVEGGGCSGFQYIFELDTKVEEGDIVFSKNGANVVVDEASLQYLDGATIEFHTELIRSAFRVVNNPLAEQGCSCGASFNIKIP